MLRVQVEREGKGNARMQLLHNVQQGEALHHLLLPYACQAPIQGMTQHLQGTRKY